MDQSAPAPTTVPTPALKDTRWRVRLGEGFTELISKGAIGIVHGVFVSKEFGAAASFTIREVDLTEKGHEQAAAIRKDLNRPDDEACDLRFDQGLDHLPGAEFFNADEANGMISTGDKFIEEYVRSGNTTIDADTLSNAMSSMQPHEVSAFIAQILSTPDPNAEAKAMAEQHGLNTEQKPDPNAAAAAATRTVEIVVPAQMPDYIVKAAIDLGMRTVDAVNSGAFCIYFPHMLKGADGKAKPAIGQFFGIIASNQDMQRILHLADVTHKANLEIMKAAASNPGDELTARAKGEKAKANAARATEGEAKGTGSIIVP